MKKDKTPNSQDMNLFEKVIKIRRYTILMVILSLFFLFAPIISFISPIDLPAFVILISIVLSPALMVMLGIGIYILLRADNDE